MKFLIQNFELCRSLGNKPHLLSSLGLLRFQGLPGFLFLLKLSYSKCFYSTLNYVSAANIQEVMKVYNVGNKTFKTGFRTGQQLYTKEAQH